MSGRRSKLPGPAAWARPRAGPGPVGVRTQLEHGRGTAVPPPGRGEAAARFTGHSAGGRGGHGARPGIMMIAAAGPLRDSDAGVPATVPVTRDSDCKTVRSDSAWAADGHGHPAGGPTHSSESRGTEGITQAGIMMASQGSLSGGGPDSASTVPQPACDGPNWHGDRDRSS